MIDQERTYNEVINILKDNNAEYKLFSHKAAFNYEELQEVQKEAGFIGTEGKCMVIKTSNGFIVCITIQGKKLDFQKLKEKLNDKKIKLAKSEELKEYFGAEPGCAYPFGFNKDIKIYLDPEIYKQDWFLFSPVFPTKTIQVKGSSLKDIFHNIENNSLEDTEIFN